MKKMTIETKNMTTTEWNITDTIVFESDEYTLFDLFTDTNAEFWADGDDRPHHIGDSDVRYEFVDGNRDYIRILLADADGEWECIAESCAHADGQPDRR